MKLSSVRIGTALVCALALSATAAAARPVIDTIVVDETVPAAIQCDGFALDVSAQGRIKVRTFLEDGQVVREVATIALRRTATNPETGESMWTPDVGVDIFRPEEDGSGTLMVMGLVTRLVVPGEGLVFADIGKVTLFFDSPTDTEPDVLFEAGRHDENENGAVVDAILCEALAP